MPFELPLALVAEFLPVDRQPREPVLAVKGVVQQLEIEKFQGKDVHRAVDVGRVHDQRGGEALLAVFPAQRRQDIQKGQVHLLEHDDAVDLRGPFPVILGQDPAHQVDGIDLAAELARIS